MKRIMVVGDSKLINWNMQEIMKAADILVVAMGGVIDASSKIWPHDIGIMDLPQIEMEQMPSPKFGSNRPYLKKKKGRS